jgi:ABC-type sugar transport system ATPase subunit
MTTILAVEGVTKKFGPNEVLKRVWLSIDRHEIRALCGENGAGKSTLMKVLAGVYSSDDGIIKIEGRRHDIRSPQQAQQLGIAFVSQELSLVPSLSILENIWLGTRGAPLLRRRRPASERARAALDRVGLENLALETPVGGLGIGSRQLVEIARMLTRQAQILILDEPTASLSDVEIQQIFAALRTLKAEGRSVIYITHRLGEVFDICDSVSILRDGVLVATRRTSDTNRKALIDMMLGRSIDAIYPQAPPATGQVALSVRALTVPRSVTDLSFDARQGSVLCLAGQVGSGAIEALRSLAGLIPDATGKVSVGGAPYRLRSVRRARRAGVRFISDDRASESIFLQLSVEENLTVLQLVKGRRLGFIVPKTLKSLARRLAVQVGVNAARMQSKADELSGGNQQRIALGRELVDTERGVLLITEPTRGVDVGARADIYRLIRNLCDHGYAVVMASSDLEEVVGISDAVITMYRGKSVACYRREDVRMQDVLADITHRTAAK